ncbi:MAG: signal peptidase II [Steroidobacteraceae bacterium]
MSDGPANWKHSGLIWWPLGVATLLLDQITKMLVHSRLALHEVIYVLPVLDILHARNPGVAFSILANAGGWQRWLFSAFAVGVSGVFLVALRRMTAAGQALQCAGLMLIVSGALGNAIDRVRFGYVVDFVAAHWGEAYFPAFNVADSCITVGAGLIILDMLLQWLRERRVTRGQLR